MHNGPLFLYLSTAHNAQRTSVEKQRTDVVSFGTEIICTINKSRVIWMLI